jgi:hypothetical protein
MKNKRFTRPHRGFSCATVMAFTVGSSCAASRAWAWRRKSLRQERRGRIPAWSG